jgi:hypothetical protein
MKVPLIAAIVAVAAGGTGLQPNSVIEFYNQVYPSDPAKRQALDLCILEDPNFNRLSAVARTSCYRHARGELTLAESLVWTGIAPNQLDLRQAADRGSVPRSDVRISQQTQR